MCYDNYVQIDFLVEKIKNKDVNALYELHDFYKPMIKVCVNKVHSKYPSVEKDDIFSESVFVLEDLCLKYDKNQVFFSYFLETRMQSYLIAKIKSKYIEKVNITELNENDYYEPCENCSFFEEHSELREEINELPNELHEIVDLIYFKQLTQSECGLILGISQAAVNKRLKKALKVLKEKLEKRL
jgi:hypothetical protein